MCVLLLGVLQPLYCPAVIVAAAAGQLCAAAALMVCTSSAAPACAVQMHHCGPFLYTVKRRSLHNPFGYTLELLFTAVQLCMAGNCNIATVAEHVQLCSALQTPFNGKDTSDHTMTCYDACKPMV